MLRKIVVDNTMSMARRESVWMAITISLKLYQ